MEEILEIIWFSCFFFITFYYLYMSKLRIREDDVILGMCYSEFIVAYNGI